jgi:hypothetical protein
MTDHLLLAKTESDALASWRWKVGDSSQVVALSLSGDIFFKDGSGSVHWLDTGAGTTELIALSEVEFWAVLGDPSRAADLLLQQVVELFLQANGPFPPGKCLGYKTLPVLGGDYAGANRVLMPAAEHFAFTGDVHQQIKDLPDGTNIEFTVVD